MAIQLNQTHNFISHFFKIIFNIILSLTNWLFQVVTPPPHMLLTAMSQQFLSTQILLHSPALSSLITAFILTFYDEELKTVNYF